MTCDGLDLGWAFAIALAALILGGLLMYLLMEPLDSYDPWEEE